MEWVESSTYQLPEGMTDESVRKALIELLRPCGPMITKEFVKLQAFKPFYDTDPDRTAIIYDMLYEDLREFPEVAVVLALDDLRKGEDRYFPTEKILPAVSEYRNFIHDCLDYFKESK